MARPAKLTAEEWQKLRDIWQSDSRSGFTWLVSENGLSVSPQAVRKRSVSEGWTKVTGDAKVTRKVTPKVTEELSEELSREEPKRKKSLITETVVENEELSEKDKVFIAEYLKDFNATQALKRTGSKAKDLSKSAYLILQKPRVQAALARAIRARAESAGMDGDRLMFEWAERITADATRLNRLKRVPCRFCYSTDGEPQYTYAAYFTEKEKHDKLRAALLKGGGDDAVDIGEFPKASELEFVDFNKKPNPDCPVCHGWGIEKLYCADTDDLTDSERKLVERYTREGGDINVTLRSKDKAEDNVAKALGLFKDKEEEKSAVTVDAERLFAMFEERMEKSRERQRQALVGRGMADVTDIEPNDD